MDPATHRRMRTAHTKYVAYCTCGKKVRGNGGKASHSYMHKKNADGHRFITEDAWRKMSPTGTTN